MNTDTDAVTRMLKRAIDLLDTALGDSDPMIDDDMPQEEIEAAYPVMCAMQILTNLLTIQCTPTAPAQSCGDAEQADAAQAVTTDDMEKAVRNSKWGKDIQSRNAFREGWKTALNALPRADEQADEAVTDAERWRWIVAHPDYAGFVGTPEIKAIDAAILTYRAKDSK